MIGEARQTGRPGDKNNVKSSEAGLCGRRNCTPLGMPDNAGCPLASPTHIWNPVVAGGFIVCVLGKPNRSGSPVLCA